MRRMLAGLAIALLLGGCAAANVAAQPVDAASLAKAAYTAKAAYAGALVIAAQVVALPRCEVKPAPCVPQAIVDQIRKADIAADAATQAGEDSVRNLKNDPTIMQLAVDNAGAAVNVFKLIVTTYQGGKK